LEELSTNACFALTAKTSSRFLFDDDNWSNYYCYRHCRSSDGHEHSTSSFTSSTKRIPHLARSRSWNNMEVHLEDLPVTIDWNYSELLSRLAVSSILLFPSHFSVKGLNQSCSCAIRILRRDACGGPVITLDYTNGQVRINDYARNCLSCAQPLAADVS